VQANGPNLYTIIAPRRLAMQQSRPERLTLKSKKPETLEKAGDFGPVA
jgi:hypothetical protein